MLNRYSGRFKTRSALLSKAGAVPAICKSKDPEKPPEKEPPPVGAMNGLVEYYVCQSACQYAQAGGQFGSYQETYNFLLAKQGFQKRYRITQQERSWKEYGTMPDNCSRPDQIGPCPPIATRL
jgi:hypothetical protein